ncbi:hypothetical protein Jinkies_36 [Arthrobacter phage Jinkies]|uniref:Uncharacterized protein n=1 Tax=Arthrobacter phage Jinkies TaxID=2743903 RepID=A0A7S6BFK4_9CAUD|nr:hypothetical protein Jinkies_36 [Arthrobacter phage Jinkies]
MVAPANKRILLESDKAAPGGLATLDGASRMPEAQLPAASNGVFTAAKYASVQAALDACAAAGGGTVMLPAGPTYVPTGGLHLPSRVTLAGPAVRHTSNQFLQTDANGYYRPQGIDPGTGLTSYGCAYLVPAAGSTGPMIWTSPYDMGYAVKDLLICGVDVYGQNITPAAIPTWTNSFTWNETAGSITSGSTTVTMSVVQPVAQMAGMAITGAGIPAGSTVVSVLNTAAKTVTISAAATATVTGTAVFAVASGLAAPPVPVSGRQAISFSNGTTTDSRARGSIQNLMTWGCGSGGPGAMVNNRTWNETAGSTINASRYVTLYSQTTHPTMVGAPISGPGIPAGALVIGLDPATNRVYLSANATATASGVALTIGGAAYTSKLQSVYSGTPAIYIGSRESIVRGVWLCMGGGDGLVIDAQDGQMDLDNIIGYNSGWGLRMTINSGPYRAVGALDSFVNGIHAPAGNAYIEGNGHALLKLQCDVAGRQNVLFGRCTNSAIYFLVTSNAGLRYSVDGARFSSVTYAAPAASVSNPSWNTGSNTGVVVFGGNTKSEYGFENYHWEGAEAVTSTPTVIGVQTSGTLWNAGAPSNSAFAQAKAFSTNFRFIGSNMPDRFASPALGVAPSTVIGVNQDTLDILKGDGSTAMGIGPRGAFFQLVQAQSYAGGAFTLDAALGNHQTVTLTGNVSSMTVTNPKLGQVMTVEFIQDATGSRTVAWPANFKFAGGAAPAMSTAANWSDSVTFRYDGTNWRETSRALGIR